MRVNRKDAARRAADDAFCGVAEQFVQALWLHDAHDHRVDIQHSDLLANHLNRATFQEVAAIGQDPSASAKVSNGSFKALRISSIHAWVTFMSEANTPARL